MNIGNRLEAISRLVPYNCLLADIGTDHAYLPVFLLLENKIKGAIAGDIVEGPCKAAANTVSMYNMKSKVQVRLGSGLSVLQPGEVDCISIAGMGGSTIVDILSTDIEIARTAKRLVLQPQTGAKGLRRWLLEHGWSIIDEELVWENKRLYEIIVAEICNEKPPYYDDVVLEIGPVLLSKEHSLLKNQFEKLLDGYNKQLGFMEKSANAVQTLKYKKLKELVEAMEALRNACNLE